MFINSQKL